jgi:hypothetical protein
MDLPPYTFLCSYPATIGVVWREMILNVQPRHGDGPFLRSCGSFAADDQFLQGLCWYFDTEDLSHRWVCIA